MKRNILLFGLIGVAALGIALSARRTVSKTTAPPQAQRPPYNPGLLYQTIVFHETQVKNDPQSALEYNMLAGCYLQRCRETGDLADALRAQAAAQKSLSIRKSNNAAGYNQLALSLFTQHRFNEAMDAAQIAALKSPDNSQAQSLVIEINTERGDYQRAQAQLAKMPIQAHDSYGKAVAARLLELSGQLPQALTLLQQAQVDADANLNMPSESDAWFHMRVGNILAEMGRPDDAEKSFAEAVTIYPNDYKTMTAWTKLAADRGQWTKAILWGEKSAAIVPTPETLAYLGDAYNASGDRKDADREFALLEAIGQLTRAQGSVYDRQRSLYLSDHKIHLDEAVSLARRELTIRHDVYAYDTLAWACYRKGLLDEANTASVKMLAHGTQDAPLFYHAGKIAEARGDVKTAKLDLEHALAINPYFHPFDPSDARATLAHLGH